MCINQTRRLLHDSRRVNVQLSLVSVRHVVILVQVFYADGGPRLVMQANVIVCLLPDQFTVSQCRIVLNALHSVWVFEWNRRGQHVFNTS